GGGGDPTITGPVFVTQTPNLSGGAGNKVCTAVNNNGCLKVVNGSVADNAAGCGATVPNGLYISPTPPYLWKCTPGATPDPAHVLPDLTPLPLDPTPLPFPLTGTTKCKVFFPGKYTAPPALDNSIPNYFVSGSYYFQFTPGAQWTVPA